MESSLKFVPKGPINNFPALVQLMGWRRPGDKPLSEPMMVIVYWHICVNWPQRVKFYGSFALFIPFTYSSSALQWYYKWVTLIYISMPIKDIIKIDE